LHLLVEGAQMAQRPLVVIGAGPKALAIHTKALILRSVGHDVPEIRIIEQTGVGAYWSGRDGFTDGKMRLYTPPERDLGFPYESGFGRAVDNQLEEYSWRAFLKAQRRLAEFYDGVRENPSHSMYQEYLEWVASASKARIVEDSVVNIRAGRRQACWVVELKSGRKPIYAQGVVVTGPGVPFGIKGAKGSSRVFSSDTFWLKQNLERFTSLRGGKVAVIGGGPGAAAVLIKLLEITSGKVEIHSYGKLTVRSKEFDRYLSAPLHHDWYVLTTAERERIARELGGVTEAEMMQIDRSKRVTNFPRWIHEVREEKRSISLVDGRRGYSHVVVATGFKRHWFVKLFAEKKVFGVQGRELEKVAKLENNIAMDLSIKGVQPRVHVPLLAGRAHGPGLPTLNCLGLLSDAILRSYVTPAADLTPPTRDV
jgi:mycobactin lysine-N-oxygenase